MVKISDECLKAFMEEDFSQSEIAKNCNLSRQAIHLRIHRERKPAEHLRWARETMVYWAKIQGLKNKEIKGRINRSEATVSILVNKHPELKKRPRSKYYLRKKTFLLDRTISPVL